MGEEESLRPLREGGASIVVGWKPGNVKNPQAEFSKGVVKRKRNRGTSRYRGKGDMRGKLYWGLAIVRNLGGTDQGANATKHPQRRKRSPPVRAEEIE